MSIMAYSLSVTLDAMVEEERMGKRIQGAMDQLGVTQADIARALGVSRMTVSQWVRDISEPRNETLFRLAYYLRTDPRYLIWGPKREPQGGFPASPASIDDTGSFPFLKRRNKT